MLNVVQKEKNERQEKPGREVGREGEGRGKVLRRGCLTKNLFVNIGLFLVTRPETRHKRGTEALTLALTWLG